MTEPYLKSLLKQVLDGFFEESAKLCKPYLRQASVAAKMYPADQSAAMHLNARLSTTSKSARPLDPGTIGLALAACRDLLREQYRAHGSSQPDADLARFERCLCRRLHLSASGTITPDDFHCDHRFSAGHSLSEFGLPDLVEWRDEDFSEISNLSESQHRSILVMADVLKHIERSSDSRAHLNLLKLLIGGAMLNHPGTPGHVQAMAIVTQAADLCHLHWLSDRHHASDDLRDSALRLKAQLKWAGFMPTLSSPTNYVLHILRGKTMPDRLWRTIGPQLDEAIAVSAQRIVGTNRSETVVREWIGAVSLKARCLAALGKPEALREAEDLNRITSRQLERLSRPYGFLYPIMRDAAGSKGKLRAAIARAAEAVDAFRKAGDGTSAAAFSALQLQLIHRYSGALPQDRELLESARTALASPVIRFKHSHVFDVGSLAKLLRQQPSRRVQVRTG